ncbi:MAG TPA: hypothetical protein VN496_15855 [Burkholderiales bacterium]|nr:hypothetical protein [Burkholderiales bacterium]
MQVTWGGQRTTEARNLSVTRTLLIAVLLGGSALFPSLARAELTLSAGIDYLNWSETTTPEVTESGPVYALGLAYTQDRDGGALFAYRGKVWWGKVDYDGATLFGGTPIKSKTNYVGVSNEAQVRWRKAGKPSGNLDGVLGAGLDLWRRSLSTVQTEDYAVGYLRLGVESGTDDAGGWTASVGFKYPVWTYLNAHFDDIGFDSNPILRPGRDVSPYGSLGYRFAPSLQVVGYYDGFRFGRSNAVQANELATGLGPTTLVQPASTMSVFGIRFEYLLR